MGSEVNGACERVALLVGVHALPLPHFLPRHHAERPVGQGVGRVPSTLQVTAPARAFSFEHVQSGPAFHVVDHIDRPWIRIVTVGLNGEGTKSCRLAQNPATSRTARLQRVDAPVETT